MSSAALLCDLIFMGAGPTVSKSDLSKADIGIDWLPDQQQDPDTTS